MESPENAGADEGTTASPDGTVETLGGANRPPKERLRVGRACDCCKRKKIRCTGKQPCERCINDGLPCEFNAPYARGKKKKKRANLSQSQSFSVVIPITPTTAHPSTPDVASHDRPPSRDAFGISRQRKNLREDVTGATTRAAGHSSRTSPEPGESDRQGHFVGASSGLSFLLRLQRRLRREVPVPGVPQTPVFTLRDAVLPEFDELAFTPPPREEAEALLKTYFELSSPTYRFLHRPTVELWLLQLYDTGSILGSNAHSKYAAIMSMFAQATRYTGAASNTRDANTGILFFQAAERQLTRETESATLTSVQALLGCCFYLLTRSRLNHCWNLFGTTSRLILALGLHRRREKFDGRGPDGLGDYIEWECRKRAFWCAYNLDKYLSAIFGRPCAFHDDDIDQDMPSLVDDRDLTSLSMNVAGKDNMNVMLGPLNHQKLGQILSRTLRRLYGIRALDRPAQYRTMEELGAELDDWRQELPAFLNPDKVDSCILVPLFQRQSNLLSLASGHVEILIYRPCLFNDYKRGSPRETEETKNNVRRCLNAAVSIAGVIDRMVEAGQLYAASWFSHYQAFCAVVVLYTYTIRSRQDDPSEWTGYFHAAERCQALIASIATADSLAQRFSVIMEEFRLEVVRQVQHDSTSPYLELGHPAPGANIQQRAQEQPTQQPNDPSDDATRVTSWLESAGQDDPLHFMDLPNWEQLDSLALDIGNMPADLWSDGLQHTF